jgi:hypothetical protein
MSPTVACRDCGAAGDEDDIDLMPATCPTCFERRVAPVFASTLTLAELVDGLVDVGCVPARIEALLRDLARDAGMDPGPRRYAR